jgi:hypothetical protein
MTPAAAPLRVAGDRIVGPNGPADRARTERL